MPILLDAQNENFDSVIWHCDSLLMQVEILKTKLEEKKEELEKLLLKLHKTQESCKQLQEENGMLLWLHMFVFQPCVSTMSMWIPYL